MDSIELTLNAFSALGIFALFGIYLKIAERLSVLETSVKFHAEKLYSGVDRRE